jgi:hypothetical protein
MSEAPIVRVDPRGFIIGSLIGEVTDEMMVECSRQIRETPEFQTGMPVLIDLTGATSVKITTDQVVEVAKTAQKDVNRIAIVAPDATAYGMARMYEIIADLTEHEDRVAVYHDEASALIWLGL